MDLSAQSDTDVENVELIHFELIYCNTWFVVGVVIWQSARPDKQGR